MKKIQLLIISLVSIILITGCSTTKEIIKTDKFIEICDNLEIDLEGVGINYDYAEDAHRAKTSNYEILFVEGKRLSDIIGLFNDDINNANKAINGTVDVNLDKQVKKGKNWKSYEASKDGVTYYIIYVDNTYLYLHYKDSASELMNKLKDAMKY